MAGKQKTPLDGVPTLTADSGRAVLISDIHFGWNTSSEEWQDNMDSYFRNWFEPHLKKTLSMHPDSCLVCLGDVFHDRVSINIDVYNLCVDVFERLASLLPVYVINGNHDLAKKTNKGNSSLRSLGNIRNLTLIREPTLLVFAPGGKRAAAAAAIPYLGDYNEENKALVRFSGQAEYAFMHTDISKMKYANGREIVGAVDAEKFAGRIFSGHIHKRQETKRVVYVGCPYCLERSDVGNVKGIYELDAASGKTEFFKNDYSPKFERMDLTKFMNFTPEEREAAMRNNYVDIATDEATEKKYKQADVYELLNSCGAKRAQLLPAKPSKTAEEDEAELGKRTEMSLGELIDKAIDGLPDTDETDRKRLKEMSAEYLRSAQEKAKSA